MGESSKSSVYLTGDTRDILNAVDKDSLSGRVNLIVGLYDEIVRREAPELTLGEWCAICDANNGTLMDDASSRTWMWANVADSQGIGEKWEINADELVRKMRAFSFPSAIAVAEIVQRFWNDTTKKDNWEWLRECGAKILDEPKIMKSDE